MEEVGRCMKGGRERWRSEALTSVTPKSDGIQCSSMHAVTLHVTSVINWLQGELVSRQKHFRNKALKQSPANAKSSFRPDRVDSTVLPPL